MAKISIDVEEIKSVLKNRALNAKTQLTDFAKQAQKDLSEKGVLKKVDQVIEIVKSQEFMKNPKVAELAKRIVTVSEQIEKVVTKNATQLVDEVRTRVTRATGNGSNSEAASKSEASTQAPKAKKSKKVQTDD